MIPSDKPSPRPASGASRRPAALAVTSAMLALTACGSTEDASLPPPTVPDASGTTVTRVAMRDGVELRTEILLPTAAADKPVPTLLLSTPYDLPTVPLGGLAPPDDDTDGDDDVVAALDALFGDDAEARLAALTVQPFVDYPGVSTLLPRWAEVLDESARGDLAVYFDTRGQSTVPGLHVTLRQDIFVECAIEDFQALADAPAEQRLLVLDGSHYDIDEPASWPYRPMLDWFDRHLKDTPDELDGTPGETVPPVRYAVQSADSVASGSRQLLDAERWPPTDSIDRSLYLGTDGTLPDVALDVPIVADPLAPQATIGGRNLVIDAGVAVQPPLTDDGATRTSRDGHDPLLPNGTREPRP